MQQNSRDDNGIDGGQSAGDFIPDATTSIANALRLSLARCGYRAVKFVLEAPRNEAVSAQLPAISVHFHELEKSNAEGPDVFRLHYLVSAWAGSATEEQALLSATIRALLLKPVLEGEELHGKSFEGTSTLPVVFSSRLDAGELSRFWAAMGQPPRPTIQCWTSVSALRPEDVAEPQAPRVRERELRFVRRR